MKLDRVGCDAGLSVLEVEEGDACDFGARAEANGGPGRLHLRPPCRCGSCDAAGCWRFGDHVCAASQEHEVNVAVVLGADKVRATSLSLRSTLSVARRVHGLRVCGARARSAGSGRGGPRRGGWRAAARRARVAGG